MAKTEGERSMRGPLRLALLFLGFMLSVEFAPARGQDWVLGDVPAAFPDLAPFDGEPGDREILGGVPSKWADLIALRVRANGMGGEHLCSGILLRADTILTAAHCLCSGNMPVRKAPFAASAEAEDLTALRAWREVADYELFPGWSCSAMGGVADLAVVFLTPRMGRDPARGLERVNGTNRAKPFGKCRRSFSARSWEQNILQLTEMLNTRPPTRMSVGGFGLDENGRSGFPAEVDLPVSSLACTSREAQRRWCRPFREMILGMGANNPGNQDSCGGDSGGPAFWEDRDGTRRLVGIVSRGVPRMMGEASASCGLGGIYTLVGRPQVMDWLKSIGVGPEDVCG